VTYAVHLGYGRHVADVLPENIHTLAHLATVTAVFTLLGAAWSKTSFALTLLRITAGRLKATVWVIIISLNLTLAANALLPFIMCNPTRKVWDHTVSGSCWDSNIILQYGMYAAGYSAAMDFALAFIPWPVIMKLQMKTKEKIGVAICMSLGLL
jgi:hypothetical protein